MSSTEALEQRGRYDRRMTREQRSALEQQHIEQAVARLLSEAATPSLSVEELSLAAGIARNTLYLHFPNTSAAVAHVLHKATVALELSLTGAELARTPRAQVTALATAWVEFLSTHGNLARALCRCGPSCPELLEPLSLQLGVVVRAAHNAGLLSRGPSEELLLATRGIFLAIGELVLAGRLGPAPAAAQLGDLTQRVFR